jgi:phospholipase C
MSAGTDNLKHIVVLMMENRSFDHLLGFAATPNWPIDGLAGTEFNNDSVGERATVSNDANYSGDFTPDPGHALFDTLTQLYGDASTPVAQNPAMNGFVLSYEGKTHNSANAHRIMKCFKPEKVPVLTQLARQFAVCDRWFSSIPGPTFPNRAFAHGSTSIGRVDMGVDWLAMSKTIYELLGENNVDAKIFYHDSTMAMTFKGLMNQGKYFALYDDFLSACKNNKLPAYSFIEPRYANGEDPINNTFFSASDQHPDHNVEQGEILIRDTFNAIWNNQALRESTILVVVYDEHGGLYDHVEPPPAVNPDNKNWAGSPNSLDPAFDFTRLGVRVPAIIISPYVQAGTIDRTQYDHSSIIATACKLLLKNVPNASLTNRDRQANTFEANLSLAQPRTEAIPISLTALPSQSLVAQGQAHLDAAHLNADINDHLAAHVEMASQLEKAVLPAAQQSGINPDDIRSEKQASDFLQSVHSKLLAQAQQPAPPPGATGRGAGN